jgi:hypothetical protein
VLLTFAVNSMLTLRILAILSNVAFTSYGIIDSIIPVLCLHAILLPLNITRLAQLLVSQPGLWQIRSHGIKRDLVEQPAAQMMGSTHASIPIGHGGMFARGASIWPRDHLCFDGVAGTQYRDAS